MTAPTRVHHGERDEFEPVYHHYGPHRAGLPPLVPYFRELWARREFAAEMSKATLRGANVNTVLRPGLDRLEPAAAGGVYYLLVTIIRQRARPRAVHPPDPRAVRDDHGADGRVERGRRR